MRRSKAYNRDFNGVKCRAIVVTTSGGSFSLYYHLEDTERALGHLIEADLVMSIDGEPYILLEELVNSLSSDYLVDEEIKSQIGNWQTRSKIINVSGIEINTEITRDNYILVPINEASRYVNLDAVDLSEIIFSDCGKYVYITALYFKQLLRSKPTELARKQMRAYRKSKQKSFAML